MCSVTLDFPVSALKLRRSRVQQTRGPRSDLLTLSPGQSNERAAQRSDKTKRNSRFGQQHADCAFSP